MSNKELQEDYTWEEISAINEKNVKGMHFYENHDCYDADVIHMGTYVIPETVNKETIQYEHPDLNGFIDAH